VIQRFAQWYHEWILWIGDGTGLPDSILHIHAGMAVLLVARLVTGRSLGTLIPFAFVVAAELGNEMLDYLTYGWRAADTYSDLANTLFWPAAISLGVRWRPMIRRDRRQG
jgi:hypothetical protein